MVSLLRRVADGRDPDEALIARALAGDQTAFSHLFQRHSASVAGFVYRLLGKDLDLDDIVQETFVDAFRQLGKVSDRSKLRSYLLTIAVRRVHARLAWSYRIRHLKERLFATSPTVSDPKDREPVHDLYRMLLDANPRQRIAWVLHRVEGCTLPEVAASCDVSLATAKRWVGSVDEHLEDASESR
jgi:RNA polymerase sigma-70 factor (ECF subfamily)